MTSEFDHLSNLAASMGYRVVTREFLEEDLRRLFEELHTLRNEVKKLRRVGGDTSGG